MAVSTQVPQRRDERRAALADFAAALATVVLLAAGVVAALWLVGVDVAVP